MIRVLLAVIPGFWFPLHYVAAKSRTSKIMKIIGPNQSCLFADSGLFTADMINNLVNCSGMVLITRSRGSNVVGNNFLTDLKLKIIR